MYPPIRGPVLRPPDEPGVEVPLELDEVDDEDKGNRTEPQEALLKKDERLIDEMRAGHGSKGPTCAMGIALLHMADEDRMDMEVAFADPSIQGSVIATVLRRRGINVPNSSVTRHRRGACACESA